MYSKLSNSYKKKQIHNFEDEPPVKKLLSDGDILIKQLSEKQRNTNVNLEEQLSTKSQFYKSTEVVSITNYTSGFVSLEEFNSILQHKNDVEKLKSCGLSNEEIQFFQDYSNGQEVMKNKHKNLNESVKIERLADIVNKIKESNNETQQSVKTTGLKIETTLALKPTSIETKLLKFAVENDTKCKERLPGPMDEIQDVEQKLKDDLSSAVDIKKIRKKARSMARQVDTLNCPPKKEPIIKQTKVNNLLCQSSKWDLKEYQPESQSKECKVYTCKPQNYYTIKNGEIVRLNKGSIVEPEIKTDTRQLSVEEIKKIAKFENYEKGTKSKTLYFKNLANGVQETDLKSIMGGFSKFIVSINILKGRMRGQAFIEFEDETFAEKVLDNYNGLFLKNKPIIIQFGKRK